MESARTDVTAGTSNTERYLDGVVVPKVAVPHSFEDVSDILQAANAAGEVVIPWGGGTMMGLGNIPPRADVALDLTRLNDVVVYEPDDLTISVQAGCRVGEITQLLAEHGQMLPFDAANPDDATVGGLYASAVSGPRRFGYGSMRDLVIGITSVAPDGEISRGGGMVVKNVSGYDMMRLHYGALGSLGVILQLNFKVLPAPRAVRTVVVRFNALEDALGAALAVRESALGSSAIVLLNQMFDTHNALVSAPWRLLLRAEGPEQSVERQAERLTDATYVHSIEQVTLGDEDSARVLSVVSQSLAARPTTSEMRLRIGVAPSSIGTLIDGLSSLSKSMSRQPAIMADLGNGFIFANFNAQNADTSALREVWNGARSLGAHATMLAAPIDLKLGTDVFGNEPAGFEVMKTLKRQFDPAGTLNRGRFIGHL